MPQGVRRQRRELRPANFGMHLSAHTCVVAGRLSQMMPDARIALIEAGDERLGHLGGRVHADLAWANCARLSKGLRLASGSVWPELNRLV